MNLETAASQTQTEGRKLQLLRTFGALGLSVMAVLGAVHARGYVDAERTRIIDGGTGQAIEPLPASFKVVSYNIHGGKTIQNQDNIPSVIASLEHEEFVEAGLQEVPANKAETITKALHAIGVFTPTYTKLSDPLSSKSEGNLFLIKAAYARPDQLTVYHQRLKSDGLQLTPGIHIGQTLMSRSLTIVRLNQGENGVYNFVNTHLEARNSSVGLHQATEVNRAVYFHTKPFDYNIMTVDTNQDVGSSQTSSNLEHDMFTVNRPDLPTFGDHFIDGIYFSKNVNISPSFTVASHGKSDHNLVVAVVGLGSLSSVS